MNINWKAVGVLVVLGGAALLYTRRANASTVAIGTGTGSGGFVGMGSGGSEAPSPLAGLLSALTNVPAVATPSPAPAQQVSSAPVASVATQAAPAPVMTERERFLLYPDTGGAFVGGA